MIALIYAHPHPARSRANRVLLDAVRTVPGINVRSWYDIYPDFSIDDAALQGHASRYRETLISSTGEGARG